MFLKRRISREAVIPSSSLADIAFLLLIFFLVTTTIDVDTGISLVMPPWIEDVEQVKVKSENIANILVDENGDCLLDDEVVSIPMLKDIIIKKIKANDKLIISLKTVRDTPYRIYIDVLDELKQAYNELREEYSFSKFGKPLDQVTEAEMKEIRKAIPQRISLAEPEKVD